MSRIRIESGGSVVEIDHPATSKQELDDLALLAHSVWELALQGQPQRLSVGFGSQLVERIGDQPVHGSNPNEWKPDPVKGET